MQYQMIDVIVKQLPSRKLLIVGAALLLSGTGASVLWQSYASRAEPALVYQVTTLMCQVTTLMCHITALMYQGNALRQAHRTRVRAAARPSNFSRRGLGPASRTHNTHREAQEQEDGEMGIREPGETRAAERGLTQPC